MANNQNNQISPLVNSSAYDPNNLSIFPDLLQQVNADMATQVLHPPAVLPENTAGENIISRTTRIVTVGQGVYYDELNGTLLVLQKGTGSTPSPTLNINPAGSQTFPGPTSNIHPTGSWTFQGSTSHIHPAGRWTFLGPTSNNHRAVSWLLPEPTTNIQPAGRIVSGPIPNIGRVPTRRSSAASSRAQIQDSDAPSSFPYPILDVPIPPRDEPPVPEAEAREYNLKCSICMNQLFEPTATKCGHLFCRSCINRAYEEQRLCPMCRKRIDTRRDLIRIYLS